MKPVRIWPVVVWASLGIFILCGLGIWFDLTGPFGRLVRSGTGTLVGAASAGLPVALIAILFLFD